MRTKLKYATVVVFIILLAGLMACSPSSPPSSEEGSHEESSERNSEHDEDGEHEGEDEHGDGSEEEVSNLYLPIDGINDEVRNGIRLTLAFDPPPRASWGFSRNNDLPADVHHPPDG